MADAEDLTDAELVAELAQFGERVQLPIKAAKRPILFKKLNHFRARAKAQNGSAQKNKFKQNAKPATPSAPASRFSQRSDNHVANRSTLSDWSRTESRGGLSHLETLSSDDSDVEPLPSASFPVSSKASAHGQGANHLGAKERKRSSNYSDNVLRTLRRRTAELPPRRTRRSEMLELSTEKNKSLDTSINDGSEEEIPIPSPARSRLYPDLSKITSFLSKSKDNTDNFESSDSDYDGSTYEVENKSVNTSFPHDRYGGSPETSHSPGYMTSSSTPSTSYASSSFPLRHRTFPSRRHYSNGPHRVQQYRSKYLEILPQILVGIAILFFIALSVTYVVIHKDYFFSWFSSSSNMGSDNHVLLCNDGLPDKHCYGREEVDKAIHIITGLYQQLSSRKGQVLCGSGRAGEDIVKISTLRDQIYRTSVAKTNAERLYECCLDHIIANPHWNIRALKEDGSEATSLGDVAMLESQVADKTLWCRFKTSFTQILYGLCLLVVVIAGILLTSVYVKYRIKQKEIEQREVYTMVEKIIDILQDHHEQSKGEDSDEPPYLAVQHVRDQLLPPAKRRKLQPIWDKAVEFIAANESRIRLETRLIHGDEFEVWHWLQPTVHNGKIWQGQAFGENNDNSSNQTIYSPTPCLKIRNMFDSNVESEDNWEDNVTDAILEKCKGIDHVVHVYVDVDSREGCVYLKCSSCEAAGKARLALNGWWFDGRLVTVKHLKTDHYHKRWPEARNATKPLKPSTDQMRSLSQPYYRSSLEMT